MFQGFCIILEYRGVLDSIFIKHGFIMTIVGQTCPTMVQVDHN